MVERQYIGEVNQIPDPGTLEFKYQGREGERSGFIVRWHGHIRVFRNTCPHLGVSLNWQENQFFNIDKALLLCSMHGAQFRPLDGLCIWGPCRGQSLQSIHVVVEADTLWICE